MNCDETQNLLHSYVDGELSPDRSLEIQNHLEDCPACLRAVENIRTLRTALASDSLYYQAPPDLHRRVLASVRKDRGDERPPRPALWRQLRFAAVPACLLLIAFLSWRFTRIQAARTANDLLAQQVAHSTEDFLVQEVVSEHIRSLRLDESHLVDVVSSNKHVVKPWFNGKLVFSPPVDDFAAQGFPLIGGRLDYLDDRPVAALVYRHRLHVINLFVWPSPQQTPPLTSTRRGYSVLRWTQAGNVFWAVSDVNPTDLDLFARLVQHPRKATQKKLGEDSPNNNR